MSLKKLLSISVISVAMIGCGDDDEGGGGGGASPDAIASALASPTGTVGSADDVQGVAAAFADQLSGNPLAAGERRNGPGDCFSQMTGEQQTCDCDAGGTESVSGSGNQQEYQVNFSWNNCCYEAECCYDGSGWFAGTNGGDYQLCYSLDVTIECGETAALEASFCMDAEGNQWFLVNYQGESFAVSGYYNSESGGEWTIRDANTTWTCVEDSTGAGCCQAEGQDDITWGGGTCP